jgi:GT2 family glycosyltransferase/tetratricopeptide (TPR) repeat protein
MSIETVAVIYDDEARPDTTGVYCLRALAGLVDVERFAPAEADRIPRGRFDLYVNVDDGLRHRLPADLRPCAWWAIDTHLDPDWYRLKAPDFDLVFAAQRNGAEMLRRAGVGRARWLPLACDPEVHRRRDVEEAYDVAFVGNLFPGPRADLVRLIERRFRRTFVGRRFFDDMARVYSQSRIVFNRSVRDDVNMRVFEALACGSLLMTNDLAENGQDELFRDGVHLAAYRDAEDLLDKIAFYLARDEVRRKVAARGREEALARHTYRHRMETILAAAEALPARASISAAPAPAPPADDTTSIVILAHDQLEATAACLDSIRRNTPEPHEVIVVDNASTDGTLEFLRARPEVRVIANDSNRGFPAAANQGIAAAVGARVLLLNNDVVTTPGWLSRLLRALGSDPRIGLVGPCSNCVSGPQQVEAEYRDLESLDAFAADRARDRDGELEDVDRLVGFCLLIRRAVIDAVGVLDERFGLGCFDDDDYTLRALAAGFRAVIARDAFVHHDGGRTFRASGVDFAALMDENRAKFRAKWEADAAGGPAAAPGAARPDRAPLAAIRAGGGGLLLVRSRVRLSLCMIVRDNARTLPACLESIRPWVDEMVVVDTGSADETPAIVEAYGGRLFHFPWCDDFSAGRNESLRHARGEWLFWMDSDDVIPPECGRGLRAIVERGGDPSVLGYVMQVHCPGGGEDGDPNADVTVVDHVKLFPNRPDLRFEGRIHEQILPAIRRAGGEVAWTDVHVVHAGSDQSPEAQRRKRERDLRILGLELAERPDHPFTLFNLGMTHVDGSRFEEGADFLRRSIAASGPDESHLRKAYALLVYAEMRLGRAEDALRTSRRARSLFPEDLELRFREGVLLHDLGRLGEAEEAYRDALTVREGRHFSSVDRGLAGFKARQNLAVVLSDMGRPREAAGQWRLVVDEMPDYRPGWRGLGEALIRLGDVSGAEGLADEMGGRPALRVEALLVRSRAADAAGDADAARRWCDAASAEGPDDLEALRWACQLLFESGARGEAEAALRRLVVRTPDDASAWHNLGALQLMGGRGGEAEASCRESLRLRPDHAATHALLGRALEAEGRTPEDAWRGGATR